MAKERARAAPMCETLGAGEASTVDVTTTAIPGLLRFQPTPRPTSGGSSAAPSTPTSRAAPVSIPPPSSRTASPVRRAGSSVHSTYGSVTVRASWCGARRPDLRRRGGPPAHVAGLSHLAELRPRRGGPAVDLHPAGLRTGFQALTEPADTSYRIDREHDPSEGSDDRLDDPELAIPWPLPVSVMSDADRGAPPLAALGEQLSLVAATP